MSPDAICLAGFKVKLTLFVMFLNTCTLGLHMKKIAADSRQSAGFARQYNKRCEWQMSYSWSCVHDLIYIYIYVRLKKKLPTMWAKWCRGYQADLVLWSESASYRSSQLEPFCSATPLGRLPAGAQRGKAVGQAEPCHQMAGCWQRKPLGGSS